MSLDVPFDEAFDALDVRLEAFAICQIGEGYSLQCAPHDQTLIHFVLKGEGSLGCEYGNFPLRSGSAMIVPPNLTKTLSGATPIRHVCPAEGACNPKDGIFRYTAGDGENELLLGCAVVNSQAGSVFAAIRKPLSVRANDTSLRGLFTAMLHELREPREGTRAFLSAIMKQLVIVMFRSDEDHQLTPACSSEERLKRALDKILQRPSDRHSVRTLAEEAGMSRARFSAQFLATYGSSPMAFVASVRLASAAQLLQTSNKPIKAVAATVGYASRSQFSAAFRKKYGLGPAAFRRSEFE